MRLRRKDNKHLLKKEKKNQFKEVKKKKKSKIFGFALQQETGFSFSSLAFLILH